MRRDARSKTNGRDAGFTILEVLVAIAVVAICLTAIGALTGTTTRGVRSLEQHVDLVETARTLAASLPPRDRLAPGQVTGELYGRRWRMNVTSLPENAALPDSPWVPDTISIRVQSPSGAALDIETIRLQRKRQ